MPLSRLLPFSLVALSAVSAALLRFPTWRAALLRERVVTACAWMALRWRAPAARQVPSS